MRLVQVRVEADCALQLIDCFGGLLEAGQGAAQEKPVVGVLGIQTHGLFKVLQGFFSLALAHADLGQVGVGGGEVRVGLDGVFVSPGGVLNAAGAAVGHAQVVVGLGEAGGDAGGQGEGAQDFPVGEPPLLAVMEGQLVAYVIVIVGDGIQIGDDLEAVELLGAAVEVDRGDVRADFDAHQDVPVLHQHRAAAAELADHPGSVQVVGLQAHRARHGHEEVGVGQAVALAQVHHLPGGMGAGLLVAVQVAPLAEIMQQAVELLVVSMGIRGDLEGQLADLLVGLPGNLEGTELVFGKFC